MSGLKQAGIIAHKRLANYLKKHGHSQCCLTLSMWNHTSLLMSFTLVVDDLGIKYVGKELAQHLLDNLRKQC